MNKKVGIAVVAMLTALAGGWYFWQRSPPIAAPPPAPAVSAPETGQPAPAGRAQPAIRYPLATTPSSPPDFEHSDKPLLKALNDLVGNRLLVLIFGDEVIRRIVKTVDNLPRASLPPDAMLLKPVPGAFATSGKGDSLVIARRNTERYAVYVGIVRRLDVVKLVGIYVDFYPLFQRAYEELGDSPAYFNDRLVEAIDDMLASPEPAGAVKLMRMDGNYQFADADFAARSAGQKMLIRMGVANAAAVKAKLRDIRQEITGGGRPPR